MSIPNTKYQIPNTLLYNWKIAGEAGYGIMNTGGPIFAKTLIRAGFFVFVYPEYPSLIRGGHNTMQVAVAKGPISGAYWQLHQLIALNTNAIIWHHDELQSGATVVYDSKLVGFRDDGSFNNDRIPALTGTVSIERACKKIFPRKDVTYIPCEFEAMAEKVGGNKIMKNVASIGAALAVFCREIPHEADILNIGKGVLADMFGKKGTAVVEANQKVMEAGYNSI